MHRKVRGWKQSYRCHHSYVVKIKMEEGSINAKLEQITTQQFNKKLCEKCSSLTHTNDSVVVVVVCEHVRPFSADLFSRGVDVNHERLKDHNWPNVEHQGLKRGTYRNTLTWPHQEEHFDIWHRRMNQTFSQRSWHDVARNESRRFPTMRQISELSMFSLKAKHYFNVL